VVFGFGGLSKENRRDAHLLMKFVGLYQEHMCAWRVADFQAMFNSDKFNGRLLSADPNGGNLAFVFENFEDLEFHWSIDRKAFVLGNGKYWGFTLLNIQNKDSLCSRVKDSVVTGATKDARNLQKILNKEHGVAIYDY
jgi:hypothetical protein